MKFDDKDLLKAMGLKVGDVIECGYTYEIKQYNNQIKCVSIGLVTPNVVKLKDFIGRTFEKVEQKIWTGELLKNNNFKNKAFHYIYRNMYNGNYEIGSIFDENEINKKELEKQIYFTREEYAEEYLEELKKFNEEYKKNNL